MGFYIELLPSPDGHEYRETGVPKVYWILYGLAGFALTCMFGAAYMLLGDLARMGSTWDLALVGAILSAIPFYLVIGIKMAWVRKFVRVSPERIGVGYRLGKWNVYEKSRALGEIQAAELRNQRPSSNLAPGQHQDSQYYIRGHWRVVLLDRQGRELILDRHVEKEALEPLYRRVQLALSGNVGVV